MAATSSLPSSSLPTISQVAERVGGEVIGDASQVLRGFASSETAQEGDLTFADSDVHFANAEQSAATAILVPKVFESARKTLIVVKDARVAMARLLPIFFPPEVYAAGIHPTALIAATAKIDPSAHIGPNVVIGERVSIGARTALLGGNHIARDSEIGEDGCLHPGVVVYPDSKIGHRVSIHSGAVIGADGFGYVFDQGQHRKILQVGGVKIGDDVEIGANAALDRGALNPTIIGDGTKIDDFVHIAHNVILGRHCLIMGQVGIAGSTQVGDYSVVASQTGIAGHLKIGSQVIIGAKSGLMRDVPDKSKILGVPAVPDRQAKRQWLGIQQLPELLQRMRKAEKRLDDLSKE